MAHPYFKYSKFIWKCRDCRSSHVEATIGIDTVSDKVEIHISSEGKPLEHLCKSCKAKAGYKAEGLRRRHLHLKKRTEKWQMRCRKKANNDGIYLYCGGTMTYCKGYDMWSRAC